MPSGNAVTMDPEEGLELIKSRVDWVCPVNGCSSDKRQGDTDKPCRLCWSWMKRNDTTSHPIFIGGERCHPSRLKGTLVREEGEPMVECLVTSTIVGIPGEDGEDECVEPGDRITIPVKWFEEMLGLRPNVNLAGSANT